MRLPRGDARVTVLLLAALLGSALAAQWASEPFLIMLLTRAAILAMAGIGLNLALGLGGLVSLGHAVFFGLGGYVCGVLASHVQEGAPLMLGSIAFAGSTSMPVIWVTSVLSCALAASVIGALALRTSGAYFIMITLAIGELFFYAAISWRAYGGEDGLLLYRRNTFPGLDTLQPLVFFAVVFVLLCAVLWLAARIGDSPFGLALRGSRQAPARVEALGIPVYRIRLLAFVVSGAITGLAGALFVDLHRFVSPTMFSWQTSGEIMIFVILGGVGRLPGPLLGACAFVLMEHLLGDLSEYWHVALGALLLFTVLFARRGLIGVLVPKRAAHG